MSKPASEKQIAFAQKLITERDTSGLDLATPLNTATTKEVSLLITKLLEAPRLVPNQCAQPGYYVTEDEVLFVVIENRAQTATYAKRLEISSHGRASWVYAPGVGFELAKSQPLSLEVAKTLGHKHGVCVVCARALTQPKSVEAGIGPVCAKKIGG